MKKNLKIIRDVDANSCDTSTIRYLPRIKKQWIQSYWKIVPVCLTKSFVGLCDAFPLDFNPKFVQLIR